ncbi:helix-turn-helix transcriptional regulator [Streptomyces malaysiensis]|uniref:helix-turn-helix transcriptional regulator n=1 Tax=Streptomyces malaysiensis TaxID=92644 RepID=UPI00359CB6BD
MLTADCLAKQVGTSKALILSYEHGKSSPSPQRLAALAEAVGVPAVLLQNSGGQLSDLRVSRGLTLDEIAAQLDLAVNTYRRIESAGVLPKRRPGVVWDLARVLKVDYSRLRTALSRVPAVQKRREAATEVLRDAITWALEPGPFQAVEDTSRTAGMLGALYRVRPSVASKVVNIQLTDLRQLGLQRAQVEARRDYAAHTRSTFLYERELDRLAADIDEARDQVPEVLEQYLSNPMTQPCWGTLAKLYIAGPAGLDTALLATEPVTALEKVFDHYLIENTSTGLALTTPGVLFFLDTLPYYRVIYAEDRALRPDPQHYGWPLRTTRGNPHRRHQLRKAHTMGHDPHPAWDKGSWLTPRLR